MNKLTTTDKLTTTESVLSFIIAFTVATLAALTF
jgi:hypothetical protein